MNPYASDLAGRDPETVIAESPDKLQQLAAQLGAQGMSRALAPGKWTVREILCHLADCEIGWAFRLRQAIAEPHHTVQPFDQELWARVYPLDATAAFETFMALRRWNLAVISKLPPETHAKPVSHPELGSMTVHTILEIMAGHDLHHLQQLETLANSVTN